MTQPTEVCPGSAYLLAPDGSVYLHTCKLLVHSGGNHVCGCGYQWPRQNPAYADWHKANLA